METITTSRHHLHQHPELSFEEVNRSRYIADLRSGEVLGVRGRGGHRSPRYRRIDDRPRRKKGDRTARSPVQEARYTFSGWVLTGAVTRRLTVRHPLYVRRDQRPAMRLTLTSNRSGRPVHVIVTNHRPVRLRSSRPGNREEQRALFKCVDVVRDAMIKSKQAAGAKVERPARGSQLNVPR